MTIRAIDRRCPECSSPLLSGLRTVWCSNIGPPVCTYGLAQEVPFVFEVRPADGWPLCPYCGEDELWSPLPWNGSSERPSVQEYIDAGLTCYRCGEILKPKAKMLR